MEEPLFGARRAAALADSSEPTFGAAAVAKQAAPRYKKRPRQDSTHAASSSSSAAAASAGDDDDGGHKRRNKHAPAELSSARPVGRFRQVVDVPKVVRRDPRFEESSGTYSAEAFQKSYGFLSDYRHSEITALREQTNKVTDPELRADMKAALQKLLQDRAESKRAESLRGVLAGIKREESSKVAAGLKKPYFPKRRELREMVATERFKELEGKGDAALAKAMRKKSKKRLGQQFKHSAMPAARRTGPPPEGGGQ